MLQAHGVFLDMAGTPDTEIHEVVEEAVVLDGEEEEEREDQQQEGQILEEQILEEQILEEQIMEEQVISEEIYGGVEIHL